MPEERTSWAVRERGGEGVGGIRAFLSSPTQLREFSHSSMFKLARSTPQSMLLFLHPEPRSVPKSEAAARAWRPIRPRGLADHGGSVLGAGDGGANDR